MAPCSAEKAKEEEAEVVTEEATDLSVFITEEEAGVEVTAHMEEAAATMEAAEEDMVEVIHH